MFVYPQMRMVVFTVVFHVSVYCSIFGHLICDQPRSYGEVGLRASKRRSDQEERGKVEGNNAERTTARSVKNNTLHDFKPHLFMFFILFLRKKSFLFLI